MKIAGTILRILIAGIAIVVFQAIADAIVPIKIRMPPGTLPLVLVTDFLTAAALVLAAERADWRGWRLGVAISAIPVTFSVTSMIESSIFLTNLPIDWPKIVAQSVITFELAVPLWMLLFAKRGPGSPEPYRPIASRLPQEALWKFFASDLSYLLLYYIAGTIVFPFVKNFYATQTLPPPGRLIAMQLVVRGPIFVGICLLLLRLVRLPRWSGALAVGAIFTVLNGVTALLIPNPYLPDAVRWAHLCEVTSSNFVFGAIVGWLWGQRNLAARQPSGRALP
ncbi:MAG: hypothetical protein ACRD4P_03380 [Bryobacteraceae bacterium]